MRENAMFRALIFSLLLSIAGCAGSSPDTGVGCDVVVQVSSHALPVEKSLQERFLWDTYAERPVVSKLGCFTAQNWSENYDHFATQLVLKAEKKSLDADELKEILDKIKQEKRRGAMLPVAAYLTRCGKSAVWVVVVNWAANDKPIITDRDNDGIQETAWPVMSLTCVFAYDVEKLELVAFISAM